MEENTFKILPTTVNDEETGREVHGTTVVIDGSLKTAMDSMIDAHVGFESYEQIVATVVINGVQTLIQQINEAFEKMNAQQNADNNSAEQ